MPNTSYTYTTYVRFGTAIRYQVNTTGNWVVARDAPDAPAPIDQPYELTAEVLRTIKGYFGRCKRCNSDARWVVEISLREPGQLVISCGRGDYYPHDRMYLKVPTDLNPNGAVV